MFMVTFWNSSIFYARKQQINHKTRQFSVLFGWMGLFYKDGFGFVNLPQVYFSKESLQ